MIVESEINSSEISELPKSVVSFDVVRILKFVIASLLTVNGYLIYGFLEKNYSTPLEISEIDNSLLVGDIDVSEDIDDYVANQNLFVSSFNYISTELANLLWEAKNEIALLVKRDKIENDFAFEEDGLGGLEHALSIAEFYRESIQESKERLQPTKKEVPAVKVSTKETSSEIISNIPIGSPVIGKITSRYGRRYSPFTGNPSFHTGIDISIKHGTPVVASADGFVKFSGRKGGYGKTVHIKHANGKETIYAHLSKVRVLPGRKIKRGQIIGQVGSTGHSTGPHLHYEILEHGKPINPLPYIQMASRKKKP